MCLGSSSSSSSISTIYQLDELEAVEPVEPVDSCPRNTDQEADARYPLLSSSSSPPPPPSPLSLRLCLCLCYIDPHHHALVIAPSIRSSPRSARHPQHPLFIRFSTGAWSVRSHLIDPLSSGMNVTSLPIRHSPLGYRSYLGRSISLWLLAFPLAIYSPSSWLFFHRLATRWITGYTLQPWLHAGSLAKR